MVIGSTPDLNLPRHLTDVKGKGVSCMTARDRHLPTFKVALKRRILTYGQKTSQQVPRRQLYDFLGWDCVI